MKKLSIASFLLFFVLCVTVNAQTKGIGIPDRSPNMDAWKGFVSPPRGYGGVPFFWWEGDTLTRDKLTWQLDQMATHHVSSLQINYNHTDKGGLLYGLSAPSKPALFTEKWWDLFGWFMSEAKKRGMTVSLSDYTLGVGQGFAIDAVHKEHPDIEAYGLHCQRFDVSGAVSLSLEESPISIYAYRMNADSTVQGKSAVNLQKYVNGKTLQWKAPKGVWSIFSVYKQLQPNSYDPMHPLSGKAYVQHFFQPFEDHFPELSKGGLNFFFSDELDFHLKGITWDDRFQKEFLQRKGYDITPYLAAMFYDIGDKTPKIRLDYNDVFVTLSEEHFFKPVYMWHQDRGLIFGCDHGGRGRTVNEFGDYFRTQRWNQGPGCDQPKLAKDIIKAKVASSIAHMYERPRVWLEGFHSSGWSTSSADVADALFADFVMGHNLLSLHGLYYSTMGGWWEWAPPCNHYRMPYWQEMPSLLGCSERLSYLLSQGYHCADVAILYPVESLVAGYGNKSVDNAFSLGDKLYGNGLDFDFMDYESLDRAAINNHKLTISGESYSVLIIPSMKALHHSTLVKALAFKRAGGTVICFGDLPEATELAGRNSKEVTQLVQSLFKEKNGAGEGVVFTESEKVLEYINHKFTRDFEIVGAKIDADNIPYIMHRKIGQKDFYALYNVPKGSQCFFRAQGNVEMWDPWTATKKVIPVAKVTDKGTFLETPLANKEIQIFVFDSSAKPQIGETKPETYTKSLNIDGNWSFEQIPVLYNKWGDYYWPATDENISAMVNFVQCKNGDKWEDQQIGYTSRFKLLQNIKSPLSEEELFSEVKNANRWEDLVFSWRWGVKDDYGHQGYHGLKEEMYNDFIRLGVPVHKSTEIVREKNPNGDHCYLLSYVFAPADGEYEVEYGNVLPEDFYVNRTKQSAKATRVALKAGCNEVLLHYLAPCTTYLVFRNSVKKGQFVPGIEKEKPLAMQWNGDLSLLPFDIYSVAKENGTYRFTSAPGLNKAILWAYGDSLLAQTENGKCKVSLLEKRVDGLKKYQIETKPMAKPAEVTLGIKGLQKGFSGTAAFSYPIRQICEKGEISIGDWTKIDGLRCYSGGAWYRKTIHLDASDLGRPMQLDLGDVVSTAHLYINGAEVGLRMTPPWTFDIGKYMKAGDNLLEIKVFNTASNHYESIPTNYRGTVRAGILGPVKIQVE